MKIFSMVFLIVGGLLTILLGVVYIKCEWKKGSSMLLIARDNQSLFNPPKCSNIAFLWEGIKRKQNQIIGTIGEPMMLEIHAPLTGIPIKIAEMTHKKVNSKFSQNIKTGYFINNAMHMRKVMNIKYQTVLK